MKTAVAFFLCALIAFLPFDGIAEEELDSVKHYMDIGEVEFQEGRFYESERSFTHAERLSANRPADLVEIYNNLGNINGYLGRPESALDYFQKALRIVHLSRFPKESECDIHKDISSIYSDLKDFKTALYHLTISENIARGLKRQDLLADCLNNKGVIYEQLDSMKLALRFYQEAELEYKIQNDPERLAMININIGVAFKAIGDLQSALLAYDKALNYSRAIPSDFYVAVVQNNRGNVLSALGRHDEAVSGTKEALVIAQALGQKDLEQNCLESLADQYAAAGEFEAAFQYHKRFFRLRDSLFNIERSARMAEMETKFKVERKELEILKLSAENERNETRVLLLVVVVGALFLAGGLFFLFYTSRQKRRKLELITEIEKTERERIAQDMHDELGAAISGITWVTASAKRTSEETHVFEKIETLANDLSIGMRTLIWSLNTPELNAEQFVARLKELAHYLLEDYKIGFRLNDNLSDNDIIVSKEIARHLFLIYKECLHNIIKHAGSHQVVVFVAIDTTHIKLEIRDDGKGFEETIDASGNGLRNMKNRAASMLGDFILDTKKGEGTTITISVPL